MKPEQGSRVAVVDDKDEERLEAVLVVQDAGFDAVTVDPFQTDARTFFEAIAAEGVAGAVLDHRLNQAVPTPFSGAELAKICYTEGLPAVLRTTFRAAGDDLNLRRYRRWLPRVLPRSTGGEEIEEALNYCGQELVGIFERERRSQRSLIEVVDAVSDGAEPVLDVLVTAWNSGEAIRVPARPLFLSVLDGAIEELIGRRFFGMVNVWAQHPDELFVDAVELADEPPETWLR